MSILNLFDAVSYVIVYKVSLIDLIILYILVFLSLIHRDKLFSKLELRWIRIKKKKKKHKTIEVITPNIKKIILWFFFGRKKINLNFEKNYNKHVAKYL